MDRMRAPFFLTVILLLCVLAHAAEPQRACAVARCQQMIITRGGDPTLVIAASGILNIAPPQVIPVDTVGAGNAFAGAFTVACAKGMPLKKRFILQTLGERSRRRVGGRSLRFLGAKAILAFIGLCARKAV